MPEYIEGAELDDATVTWVDADGDLYNFASGYTFTVKVGTRGQAALITKTTGITGAAVAPNITIAWATTGELDQLEPGTYVLQVHARRSSDSKDLVMQDSITITEAVA